MVCLFHSNFNQIIHHGCTYSLEPKYYRLLGQGGKMEGGGSIDVDITEVEGGGHACTTMNVSVTSSN